MFGHMIRLPAAALLGLVLVSPSLASAQHVTVAAGYASMPGRIGERDSDHGVALRVDGGIAGGRHLSLAIEGGIDRLNLDRRQFSQTCGLPAGGTTNCHHDIQRRDTGWSIGSILRLHALSGRAGPYALVGAGFISVRTRDRTRVVDDAGNRLTNLEGDGTTNDDVLVAHLGAGVVFRPSGLPFGLVVEGRASRNFYNYSGGLQADWYPTVTAGIRLGR